MNNLRLSDEDNRIYKGIDEEFKNLIKDIENDEHCIINPDIIRDAYETAKFLHHGVIRKSGEFYLYHPFNVCRKIYKDGFADVNLLAAALLHDTVEDTSYTLDDIERDFNKEVRDYVDAVTKIDKSVDPKDGNTKNMAQWHTDSHMIECLDSTSKFALYIKFVDRWHNLNTCSKMSEDSIKYNVNHTQNVLIPLARKIGCNLIAEQLEDACFLAQYPEQHSNIKGLLNLFKKNSDKAVRKLTKAIFDATKEKVTLSKTFEPPLPYIVANEIKRKHNNPNLALKNLFSFYQYKPYSIVYFKIKEPTTEPLKVQFFRLCENLIKDKKIFDCTLSSELNSPVYNILNDCVTICDAYNNIIQVIIISEEDYRKYINAIATYHNHHQIISPETLDPKKGMYVYSRDGATIKVEMKCTVLDYAFYISTDLGIHFSYATVNGEKVPIDYELKPWDRVEIFKEIDVSARINWFSLLQTRLAINRLVFAFENRQCSMR